MGGDFLFIVVSFYIRCKEDFLSFFYLSFFRWKEVQDVEKRVKMEQEMIHQANQIHQANNPALLPDSHSDL